MPRMSNGERKVKMKKAIILSAVALAVIATGCEHVNFDFDWGMLAESVVNCFHTAENPQK